VKTTTNKETRMTIADAAFKPLAVFMGDLWGAAKYNKCNNAVQNDSPLNQSGTKVEERCAGRTAATEECTTLRAIKVKKPKEAYANSVPMANDSRTIQMPGVGSCWKEDEEVVE